ncbi:hypothetical protein [Streptomyces sp. NPDC059742]|uniref:hypothetical protein n=1 Tax=Streptomyces sp. NPDC059742 TaxID=3346927 RepID=UPI0036572111
MGPPAGGHRPGARRPAPPHGGPALSELLRGCPRGNEADDDLWSFVPHRQLPLWLWRHHLWERLVERMRRPFA